MPRWPLERRYELLMLGWLYFIFRVLGFLSFSGDERRDDGRNEVMARHGGMAT